MKHFDAIRDAGPRVRTQACLDVVQCSMVLRIRMVMDHGLDLDWVRRFKISLLVQSLVCDGRRDKIFWDYDLHVLLSQLLYLRRQA